MVARSFQVFLITFLVLKPSLACLEAEIYLYLRLKIVFRQSSLQPSSYFLGHPVSQIRYHIWDKSEQQQSAGRLSFIYAGEGQADDEGIPGKGIFSAGSLLFKYGQEESSGLIPKIQSICYCLVYQYIQYTYCYMQKRVRQRNSERGILVLACWLSDIC